MTSRYPVRHAWPTVWLFAEPRLGDLPAALDRLPRGAGVVVGFGDLDPPARRRLLRRIGIAARRRRLVVIDVTDPRVAKAHDRAELVAARRRGARLVFVAPVFATRSHPGAPSLGRVRLGLLVRGAGVAVAALGGMTAARFRSLRGLVVAWGAIDAWAGQSAKAKSSRCSSAAGVRPQSSRLTRPAR